MEGFKRLYQFATRLRAETFPMATDREVGFQSVMESLYWSKLQMDQVYFDDRTEEILDLCANYSICLKRGELIEDTEIEVASFLENDAFKFGAELATIARHSTSALREAVQHADTAGGPSGRPLHRQGVGQKNVDWPERQKS